MINISLLLLSLWLSVNATFAQQAPQKSFLELSRIEVVPIRDTEQNRQYELYIKLPEAYADTVGAQYPVIYYTDAMWHVEMLSGATEYIMEKAILVGISWQLDIDTDILDEVGAHVSRYRDYSFLPSSKPDLQAKYQFGQADKHVRFIREEVMALVERNYRTDPDHRTYFGYSMGGMFGAYILLAQSDTFDHYILGSPSLWRANPTLAELSAETASLDAQVFISYGSQEDELSGHVDTFISILKDRSDQQLSWHHAVIEGTHQTAFPMTAVKGVQWLVEKVER